MVRLPGVNDALWGVPTIVTAWLAADTPLVPAIPKRASAKRKTRRRTSAPTLATVGTKTVAGEGESSTTPAPFRRAVHHRVHGIAHRAGRARHRRCPRYRPRYRRAARARRREDRDQLQGKC